MFSAQFQSEEVELTQPRDGMLVAPGAICGTSQPRLGGNHMDRVYRLWIGFVNRPRSGQSMAEYALVITLVAAAGLAVWSTLGGNIKNVISSVAGCI